MEGGKALRDHARAIRIEDLCQMMDWSEKTVPSAHLAHLGKGDIMVEVIKHVLMRAFLSSGFTLWTRYAANCCHYYYLPYLMSRPFRNAELCSLQTGDLVMGCMGPTPHFYPHFRIQLLHRKGWQKQLTSYDGPLRGESKPYRISGTDLRCSGTGQVRSMRSINKMSARQICTPTSSVGYGFSKRNCYSVGLRAKMSSFFRRLAPTASSILNRRYHMTPFSCTSTNSRRRRA